MLAQRPSTASLIKPKWGAPELGPDPFLWRDQIAQAIGLDTMTRWPRSGGRARQALPHKGCCRVEGTGDLCGHGMENESHASPAMCAHAPQPLCTRTHHAHKGSLPTISELERSQLWSEAGMLRVPLNTLLPGSINPGTLILRSQELRAACCCPCSVPAPRQTLFCVVPKGHLFRLG